MLAEVIVRARGGPDNSTLAIRGSCTLLATSMSHDLEPVIIGVGEVANRSKRVEDAREPLHLMLEAINAAFDDAGLSLNAVRSHVDSLDVIRTWTWPYKDLPSLLASKLGLVSGRRYESPDGGNQPGKLLDEACQRLARGDSTMCLLTGGEALASCEFIRCALCLPEGE
jgi:hypothetical protein